MNDIDQYIAGFDPEVQKTLKTIRAIVKEEAPEATERICMRMPTYDLGGKWLVHFAAFPKHIGFYPQPEGIAVFQEELRSYTTSKGSVQFPLNKPIPFGLIREIVRRRVKETMDANA